MGKKRQASGKRKVTERKKLPYHARHNVLDAIAEAEDAQRMLMQILSNHLGREEHYRLIGLIILKINSIADYLKDISL